MADHHEYCTGGFSPNDIVISGISGRFPECDSLEELKKGLLNQKNFLIPNGERFEKGAADLPFGSSGTIKDLDKFDVEFFGYSVASANSSDPLQRLLMEVSYEAMADAGYEPTVDFSGADVGVYTACSNEDGKEIKLANRDITTGQFAPGYLRCMLANRLSHTFDFHGPSFTMDTACSSGLVAMWAAYNDIKEGRAEAAVVNAGQLCLSPIATNFYFNCGIISPTGECNPFDARANGIVRTEAVTALFLQKASKARRAYASIMSMKHSAAGHVPEGVYVPSFKQEYLLFLHVLKETGVNVNDVQFIEAHGTGTHVGDPIEVNGIEAAYCEGRETPLYIGSVKSSLGHPESAAGQTGAIKAIFAFETGIISPNQGYQTPNPNCQALKNGKIKVVDEPLPLTSDYIPVNSFGFGGSMMHTIFKRNPIEYSKHPEPQDLPRLVLYAATTEAAVFHMFEYIENNPDLRAEFFALVNKLSFPSLSLKPFRGYAVFQNEHPVIQIKNCLKEKKREVWFVMNGMGSQWPGMGLEMMEIKVFADSMMKTAAVLKPLGVDLFEFLKKDQNHLLTDRSIIPAFVTIAAIQIALVDLLRYLEIYPDGIIGHSTGELICAYADGCCTAEETILSAYWRGRSVESANLPNGAMAAVGLTWEEAVRRCPEGVYPACHNAEDSVTISGLKEPLERFVAELQQENIFARVVNAYGYAFHSEHVWPVSKILRKALSDVIKDSQRRSERWVSTSYPEGQWNSDECKMAGPEYFVNNLVSVVRFHDVLKRIPSDAITIEIGPHFLLQSILKRSIGSDAIFVALMKRNDSNNIGFLLESLGKLYVEGVNPKIEKLYRPVKFPVPRNTPMICDLIKWDHSQSFEVPSWKPSTTSYQRNFQIESTDSYLLDHFIDGRSLFPATGYIYLAWKALSKKLEKNFEDINVIIEDFKIHRATMISPTTITFSVTILDSSGTFEILESGSIVASGKVYEKKNVVFSEPSPKVNKDSSTFVSGEDIYNELRIHGYEYGPNFRKLVEISLNGMEGFVEWKDNWIPFMDSLLLFFMITHDRSSFKLPTGALHIKICPKIFKEGIEESLKEGLPGMPVNFHSDSNVCRTIGLEIRRLEVDPAAQHTKSDDCIFEEYKFVPYVHKHALIDKSLKLEKYKIACNKFIDSLESNIKLDSHRIKFSVKQKIDFDVDSYIADSANGYSLLTTLKELAGIQKENCGQSTYKDILDTYVHNIGQDFANVSLVNDHCLRFMFDIISENSYRKISILEINNNFAIVLPIVSEVVEKYSMLKFKSKTLVSKNIDNLDKEKISECNIKLCSYNALPSVAEEKSQGVVISAICVSTEDEARKHLHLLSSVIQEKGFILLFHKDSLLPPENLVATISNEAIHIVPQAVLEQWFMEEDLLIVSKIFDDIGGNLYLLRHTAGSDTKKIIQVSENTTWLDDLKLAVSNSAETLWVTSEDYPQSGIIGMINCLRHEPGGDRIRCVFIPERNKENAPPLFSFEDKFFQDVLKKDLVMNVFKDGTWGSFRHIRTDKERPSVEVDYSYLNIKKYGDLSSLVWMESALNYIQTPDQYFVHIYYSALNFRDIMLATGKISLDPTETDVADRCVLGLEYAGRTNHGERVAGFCRSRGLATATVVYPHLIIPIPEHWSLEDAATVPVVYFTCYYALIMRACLQPGESILIHSGTGGTGQAAINIALSMNCEVYTTVGTEEKRQYLLKNFPRIKPENIGCSRNTTFEKMISSRTKGRGVDVVLNSLADDKFLASIRCVATHGRFVEIGKYDLSMDHKIGLKFMLKNITFHAVFLDQITDESNQYILKQLREMVRDGIKTGVVKPLNRTVFQRDEAEQAFRYMGKGTHIGKVLIKIRDEEKQRFAIPQMLRLPAAQMTYFYSHKVYIVIGGLGGFGIEVSNWLLEKGVRNLVLTTRYGARTPYHHLCLQRWKDKRYNVMVSTKNVSLKDEAEALLREVAEIGPVGGIFNSAVVLHDAFLENTNWENFKEVCAPKADATINLDILSRSLCPELDHFVCFSSISCGRGNAGQMNYGFANSVMERVCERRRADGLPGLAIQWGIIGEVGVVHRHMGDDAMIAGVGAQRVKSCLDILDVSCQRKKPVVCSYVIKDSSRKLGDRGDVLQQLARIFGMKDTSEFNALRSFGELGVDSMIGIEVRHLLETTCDVTLTMQEIQELKIDDVKMLIEKVEAQRKNDSPSTTLVSTACVNLPKSFVHSQAVQLLNDVQSGVPVFIIDIDCYDLSHLRNLAAAIKLPVFALLLSKDVPTTGAENLALWYLQKIKEIAQKEAHIIAHSSASILALEMILQSEKVDKNALTLTILNGSSSLMKIPNNDDKLSEADILCEFVANHIPSARDRLKEQLPKLASFEQQVRCVVDLFTKSSTQTVNKTELTGIVMSHVMKVQLLQNHIPQQKICKDLLVIEDSSTFLANDVAEVKALLSELCSGKITIQRIPDLSTFNEESVKKIVSSLNNVF